MNRVTGLHEGAIQHQRINNRAGGMPKLDVRVVSVPKGRMPNGENKGWVRFLLTLRGFRVKHDRWPSRMRLEHGYLDYLRGYLEPADFAKLQQKLVLLEVYEPLFQAVCMAEDESGSMYEYARESLGKNREDVDPEAWLGIRHY
jgi:hypothetical protein